MGAAMNNIHGDIRSVIEEVQEEASQAKKYYNKWTDQKDQKIHQIVDS
jgi:hypothetical protein